MVVGFDESLSILENPTRRSILRHLVKEPHYPLQLSELLDVSQQAVVKHQGSGGSWFRRFGNEEVGQGWPP